MCALAWWQLTEYMAIPEGNLVHGDLRYTEMGQQHDLMAEQQDRIEAMRS